MTGHSQGTSLQSPLQGSTKTSPQGPRCPGLLSPYKRAGQDPTKRREARHQSKAQYQAIQNSQHRDQHLKQSSLYSFFSLRLGLAALSRNLVTPTQAPRCKEIQNSPLPAGRRAFFCPNQDKPPCVLLASPSRLGTRSTHSSV
jgi:hypothetical protein